MKKTCELNSALNGFFDYFTKNWHKIRQMWTTYALIEYENIKTFTNNRSEANNRNIKRFVDRNSKLPKCFKGLLYFSEDQFQKLKTKNIENFSKDYKPTDVSSVYEQQVINFCNKYLNKNTNEIIRNEFKEAVQLGIKGNFKDISDTFNQTSCTLNSGICMGKNQKLPCKHLFLTKMINHECLIEVSFFDKRWIKQEISNELSNTEAEDKTSKFVDIKITHNDRERFNCSKEILKDITKTVSRSTDKERAEMATLLNELNKHWINDDKVELNVTPKAGTKRKADDDAEFEIIKEKKKHPFLKNDKTVAYKKRQKLTDFCSVNQVEMSGDCNENVVTENPISEQRESIKNNEQMSNDELNDLYLKLCHYTWDKKDFDIMESKDQWINDSHIRWISALIEKECPQFGGLEYTGMFKYPGFKNIGNKMFLQPVLINNNHWILYSNIFIEESKRSYSVDIYDSNINSKKELPSQNQEQLCQLLRNDVHEDSESEIELKIMPCQQQNDGFSCGLFVIANMISLSLGLNPSEIHYTGNLRKEIFEIIKEMKLKPLKHKKILSHNIPSFKYQTTISGINMSQSKEELNLTSIKKICFCRMPKDYTQVKKMKILI